MLFLPQPLLYFVLCFVVFTKTNGDNSRHIYILPLSHKSGELCLYEPLTVSDVFGDNFFEILSVFRVKTHFFFFFLRTNLHVLAANKKVVRPKMAVFDPFPEGAL